MHEGLWQQLEKLDVEVSARRARCGFNSESETAQYVITFLNRQYMVDVAKKEISTVEISEPSGFLEQLCILGYLITAKDIPLSNKLVRARSLPGGDFFFRGIHDLPTDKLAQAFGSQPEKLYDAMKQLDARRCDYGDASMEILLLPRIPLTVIVWGADEEFDARASILFDRSAGDQIALDALGAAVNLTVNALTKAL